MGARAGWLIVGLGNPGERYAYTRHNLGFWVVDEVHSLARAEEWTERGAMRVAMGLLGGEPIVLLKPLRWMNLSGGVVASALAQWPVAAERLVVACDDVALPDCRIRIRVGGSSGGHKGLASVIEEVGFDDFVRVRIGVGTERSPEDDLSEFVLRPMTKPQIRRFSAAARAAANLLAEGIAQRRVEPTTVDALPLEEG